MNIVQSDTGVTSGAVVLASRVSQIKFNATGDAVVTVNNQSFPVYAADGYLSLDVDVSSFVVASGTIDYIALG